jgi:hypothetical protein
VASSRIAFLCGGLATSSESAQEPAVAILDLAETTRDRLLVLDPDLSVRFADRSFGDAFTVTPKDTPRDQEGQQ